MNLKDSDFRIHAQGSRLVVPASCLTFLPPIPSSTTTTTNPPPPGSPHDAMVGVAGFSHASLTKGLLILTSIVSVLTSLFQLKPHLHFQFHPHLTVHHQWYRLFTQHFAFTNSSELFLALLLLYNAGVKVERTFGTRKFAAFLFVTTALYTGAQLVVLGIVSIVLQRYSDGSVKDTDKHWLALGRTPAGPWAPLFASTLPSSLISGPSPFHHGSLPINTYKCTPLPSSSPSPKAPPLSSLASSPYLFLPYTVLQNFNIIACPQDSIASYPSSSPPG